MGELRSQVNDLDNRVLDIESQNLNFRVLGIENQLRDLQVNSFIPRDEKTQEVNDGCNCTFRENPP
jgi:hypothetical protein